MAREVASPHTLISFKRYAFFIFALYILGAYKAYTGIRIRGISFQVGKSFKHIRDYR